MKNQETTAGKENGKIADGALSARGVRVTKVKSLKSKNATRTKRINASFTKKCLGSGGGRIRPYTKQHLCLKQSDPKVSRRKITLQDCDDDSYDNHEIFDGFSFNREFKLVPKEIDDHCLSQSHFPKSGERVYVEDCDEACDDATCLWETIYES